MTALTDVAPVDLSIRDLEKRWGISRNGLKARARALGVDLIRVSSTLTTWPGAYVELGERLHDHLQSGQPMGTFPGLKPLAMREAASVPAADPLLRARGLAEAADCAWSSPPPIWRPSWVRG
ncbi:MULTISPECIES: hypothetical protein [unclassified Cyanobium]|uniref:hypothetical protein n=1 Tax=unclassified Cyanobium TaxID=2627006 RepID=UPI0020CE54F9|nr:MULTISPECIES: hypothetical protein [unclassified Cyanobium]MCP9832801.1 hypothetical protein [Cyanobium sp. La Preciosa 7G6]MCP9935551.1 hypothetical protein [Cyanobium sp. Aljojuca 7A6]